MDGHFPLEDVRFIRRGAPLWDARYPRPPVRPSPLRPNEVQETLARLLPSDKIEQFAREGDFLHRERKVHPVAFLCTLALDFGAGLHCYIEEPRPGYTECAQLPLSYPGVYLRFTPSSCSSCDGAWNTRWTSSPTSSILD